MPSDVPARSQTLPGRTVAVPSSAARKSAPPAKIGIPRRSPASRSPSDVTEPAGSPVVRNGGNRSGSRPQEAIESEFQMYGSNSADGVKANRSPVNRNEMYSGHGRNDRVRVYAS